MFNKNIFFSHTTNTTNHNKITNAGVKAPFSMNEQAFLFPTMYSGDQRPDVSRTGSPGRRDLGGMVGQAGNLAAAQLAAKKQNMISSLLDSHVHNAYQSGIDIHGHWDLTEKDSNAIIKPHFGEYFDAVRSIDPNANRESHYGRFNAAVEQKAAKLHGWGQSPTMNEQFYLNESSMKRARLNKIKPYDYDEYESVHREGMRVHGADSAIHAPIHAAIYSAIDDIGSRQELSALLRSGKKAPFANAYKQAFVNAQEAGRHASENPDDEIHHPNTASFVNARNTSEFGMVMPRNEFDEIMRSEMERTIGGGH